MASSFPFLSSLSSFKLPFTLPDDHLPAFLSTPINDLSSSTGFAADQLRLMVCMLSAILLGFLHKSLPNPTIKHLYSTLIGMFFGFFVVGWQSLHVMLFSLLMYVLIYALPLSIMTPTIFLLSISYLSTGHIYRMVTDYGGYSLDVTILEMVCVVKFVTFAFNWSDGLKLQKGKRLAEKAAVQSDRESRAITAYPSLLEYMSFIWYYGGVLVGPCFEIRYYLESTDLSLFKKAKLSSVPSTIMPTLNAVGRAAIVYGGVYMASQYPINGVLNSAEYLSRPLINRFLYFTIAVASARCKYYFVWYLAEAGCIASGLSFNPAVSGASGYTWDRLRNAYHMQVEFGTSMPQFTNNWNLGVNNWLKHYVYFRMLEFHPSKALANIVTKLTAAIWHGFYGSYYLFFLGAFFVNEMDDALRANVEPWFMKKKTLPDGTVKLEPNYPIHYVYDVLAWSLVLGHMNYLGGAFILLEWNAAWTFWGSFYYYIFWLPLIIIGVSKAVAPKREKKSKEQTKSNGTVTSASSTTSEGDSDTRSTRSSSNKGSSSGRPRSKKAD